MDDLNTQVAIVGGGPVGLGLAIDLGQRGISAVVIEKEARLHTIPKGQNLTQRTMEHFRAWGVEAAVRAARLMPAGYPSVGINSYGDLMSSYAHPWFRRSQVGKYYFTTNDRLPQYLTERVLRDRLMRIPEVTTIYGQAAQVVQPNESGVLVGGEKVSIRAEYVVGCDGSRSMVRAEVGITEQLSDHDRKMVLVVFRSKELHRILEERFGQAAFFNVLHPDLDGYWRFLGRVDVGESWFFHAPAPSDAIAETFDYEALISATVGSDIRVELEYIGFWDLRVAIADTYQAGRVFIAGDAAHSHPPYGGYGINTGLEDIRNLGWKLSAVLQGWGGEDLLASYTTERRPVFVSTARDFIEAFINQDREFIEGNDPRIDESSFAEAWDRRSSGSNLGVSDFEPHYEGSPIVFGPMGGLSGAVGSHSFSARSGHHLPARALSSGDDLFEELGDGFTLVGSTSATTDVDAFRVSAKSIGVPLTILLDDFQGELADYDTDLILVRPDHFISWVNDGSSYDSQAVLSRSVGL